MGKVLKQSQNKAKALEVRLEEHTEGYYVILAGMTINFRTACNGGLCEGGFNEHYVALENETFQCSLITNKAEAEAAYLQLKQAHLD